VAAEEAKGGKASKQKYKHRNGTITSERHSCETDKSLKKTISERHLPVGDGHFVCQDLVDVPSVGLEKVFAVFQRDIYCFRSDCTFSRKLAASSIAFKASSGGTWAVTP
jgi:hypothetical protein